MDELTAILGFVSNNWELISAAVGGLVVLLAAVAEITPFDWDNKVIRVVRELWSKIPLGERDPDKMGRV